MRVLHIDTLRVMRGGQWQVLYLLERLKGRLLAPAGAPLYERAHALGLEVEPLSRTAIREARVDLVHAHDAHAHTLAALLARAPVVVSRRVAFPIGAGLLSRWKYRRPAHFIAVSEYVRHELEAGGVAPARISVVYDGVPPREPAPGGPDVVAPAIDDPLKGSALLREAAARAGIAVRFADNLPEALNSATLLVYLSQSEGLGSAALLAMSAGVPVIASRVGGLPEIVEDGVTGVLVENDPGAVAAALTRLLADEPLRRRLGAEGRRRVIERYTVDAMASATAEVYRQVLGGDRSPTCRQNGQVGDLPY